MLSVGSNVQSFKQGKCLWAGAQSLHLLVKQDQGQKQQFAEIVQKVLHQPHLAERQWELCSWRDRPCFVEAVAPTAVAAAAVMAAAAAAAAAASVRLAG
mmetsp:Transcript_29417/g.73892  ORF Transcript_29417/g.73892 Transcript_29417/m.73892 type:complete len:99 (-) Transcript_29417:739-1035(-)